MLRRRWVLITGGALAAIACAVFLLSRRVDPLLRRKLAEACPRCEFGWDELRFGPTGLKFRNFSFRSPVGEISVYALHAPSLEIRPRWRALARRKLDIENITAADGEFRVMEKAGHVPAGPPPTSEFAIRGVHVRGFRFVYELREYGKLGRIRIHDINADISAVGTTPDLRGKGAIGRAEARLESTGRLFLEVSAVPFQETPNALVKLSLDGLRLAETNEYFLPIDGVRLQGEILRGNASAEVKGDTVSAWADIRYRDFDVHFQRTKFRGGLKSLLSNIVADLKLEEENRGAKGKAVGARRLASESLVSFILRGLKQAAFEVASD